MRQTPQARRIARLVDDPRFSPAVHAYRIARMLDRLHGQHVDAALRALGGTDPGPLISAIVSERFPERTKRRLRRLAHASTRYLHRAYALRPARFQTHTLRCVLRAACNETDA
jgi:hypothetical protein